MTPHTFALPLPAAYPVGAVLAFHGRDRQARAERVSGQALTKAVATDRGPCVVSIELSQTRADCQVSAHLSFAVARGLVRRLLGLDWDVAGFEAGVAGQSPLGELVLRQRGLVIPMAATPFEALSWAITGQQINLAVAITLRRRLIEHAGGEAGDGLRCHPAAAEVASLTPEQLGALGYSKSKARALALVSQRVVTGELPLERWLAAGADPAEISSALLEIPGIGPWTVNYTLLRGFGCADCSLHGDVAVRNALQRLLGLARKPTQGEAERWLAQWSPWRSLVAAHLWAALG